MIRSLCAAAAASLLIGGAASAQELAATATPSPAATPADATAPAAPTSASDGASTSAATATVDKTAGKPAATNLETAILNNANDYRIGPEDLLDISVWKNPELSRTVPVRPDGKVSLPLVNDIQAAGLTPTALREQLIERLAEFIPAPEVAVIVREVHSMKVAVVGAVRTPGRYELRSAATVLEMIALAQGFTDFASRDRIVILRQENGESKRIPFNYRKMAAGDEQANLIVQPGDIIVVP
jgi:polysaccharide export outer membrane protein